MAQGDGNPGMNMLAKILNERMKQYHDDITGELTVDFGKITKSGNLKVNSFPVTIKKGDFWVCESSRAERGDSVVVVWVQDEACVIDKIISSSSL